MTRVFPDPAPARINTGPSVVSTAARCCVFSFSRRCCKAGPVRETSYSSLNPQPFQRYTAPFQANRFHTVYYRITHMDPLNEQHRKANIERIASHTVGIASDGNTGVGTGVLALLDGQKFILTAKHVLGKSTPDDLRFWLRPPTAIRDKAAKDTTNEEVGRFTIGVKLPIVD